MGPASVHPPPEGQVQDTDFVDAVADIIEFEPERRIFHAPQRTEHKGYTLPYERKERVDESPAVQAPLIFFSKDAVGGS